MRYLGSKDETTDLATQSDTGGGGGGSPIDAWPVGSIFMSTVSTNPATLLGGGTWAAWGAGRVPVGIDATQTEFDTVEEVGGAKTHTLSAAEMPIHSHTIHHDHGAVTTSTDGEHTHEPAWMRSAGGQGTQQRAMAGAGTSTLIQPLTVSASGFHTHTVDLPTYWGSSGDTGSGNAHNNLQPYIVCYMWKRTA